MVKFSLKSYYLRGMDKKFKTFFVLFKEELEPRLKNKIYVPKVYSKYTTRKVYRSAVLWIFPKFWSRVLFLELWEIFKITLNDILNNFERLFFTYCWCQTSSVSPRAMNPDPVVYFPTDRVRIQGSRTNKYGKTARRKIIIQNCA